MLPRLPKTPEAQFHLRAASFHNALLNNENNNNNNKILTMCNEQSYLKQHNPVAVRISMKNGIKRFKTKSLKTFIAKSFHTHILT